jgi:hypothetical protein
MAPKHHHSDEGRFDDESIKEEVHQMIIEESDPKEKVRLLMLMQLNTTLVSNVIAVRNLTTEFKEHRLEFDSHIKEEERIINTGRGAIWAVIALIGFIQMVTGYLFTQHMDRFDKIYAMATVDHNKNEIQDLAIKNMEDKFTRVLDKLDRIPVK